jgi:hypothetical protein
VVAALTVTPKTEEEDPMRDAPEVAVGPWEIVRELIREYEVSPTDLAMLFDAVLDLEECEAIVDFAQEGND